jgi:small subunit ribosomal protein S5
MGLLNFFVVHVIRLRDRHHHKTKQKKNMRRYFGTSIKPTIYGTSYTRFKPAKNAELRRIGAPPELPPKTPRPSREGPGTLVLGFGGGGGGSNKRLLSSSIAGGEAENNTPKKIPTRRRRPQQTQEKKKDVRLRPKGYNGLIEPDLSMIGVETYEQKQERLWQEDGWFPKVDDDSKAEADPEDDDDDDDDEEDVVTLSDSARLYSRVISVGRVARMTKQGRKVQVRALVIVGNGNGCAGYGIGKGQSTKEALERALLEGEKDLVQVDLTPWGSLYHDVQGKCNSVKVIIKAIPCHRVYASGGRFMGPIMQCLGLSRYSAAAIGRSKNPYTIIQAVFDALGYHTTPQDVAFRKQRILLDRANPNFWFQNKSSFDRPQGSLDFGEAFDEFEEEKWKDETIDLDEYTKFQESKKKSE